MTVSSQVKNTLASLKGVQETLRMYSTQSQSKEERKIYKESIEVTKFIIEDLENRIKKLEFEEPQYKGY
ncbi:DUF1657 domain-containing protein [Dethiothermospora halolimnae]|uniref:DUF1657 domain-containing protein n=1 Tax=Dethiothermospora halolimnae TaxID=3114390 RepID=UPI003CCBF162